MTIVGQVVRALTRNDKTKIEKMLQVGDIDTLLYLKAILEYWREQEKKTFCIVRDWADDTMVLVSMSIFYS